MSTQEQVSDTLFLGLNSIDRDTAGRALDIVAPLSVSTGITPTSVVHSLPAGEAVALLHTAVERHCALSTHRQILRMLV
jgi:hypothetical protein